MHYQKLGPEDIAAKANKMMDKVRDKNDSSSDINLINSDTESSASNNISLHSNSSRKVGTFTFNNTRMRKAPSSEWF